MPNEGGGPLVNVVAEELFEAQDNLKNAVKKFNEVESEFIEDAIYEITEAESRYSALLRKAREKSKEQVENDSNKA